MRTNLSAAKAVANRKLHELGSQFQFTIKVVGTMKLAKTTAKKVVRRVNRMSDEDRAKMFARLKEARKQFELLHITRLLQRGIWVPTWKLEMFSEFELLKQMRRQFCKRVSETLTVLKWTIGSCFNGVKDFMKQLQESIIVIG